MASRRSRPENAPIPFRPRPGPQEEEPEEDGANVDLDAHRKGKCCVLKTSTRQTIFLPIPGLIEPEKLKPADLVGVNKDSYLILEALPAP